MSGATTPREQRPKAKIKTLVGIVRVGSSTRRRTGDSFISPQLQVEGMREWVEHHPDYRLPDELVLEEYDVSGARPLAQRPGLSRALELIEDGAADGVIGVRLDRIARSPKCGANFNDGSAPPAALSSRPITAEFAATCPKRS